MTHVHPEAQQYADAAPELIAAANPPPTINSIRREFSDTTITDFLADTGYHGLTDILRDYDAEEVRLMLFRFVREVRS